MSFCPKCGKEQLSDAQFCGSCGTALGAATRGGTGTSAPKKAWIYAIAAVSAIVVIGVVLLCSDKIAVSLIPASQRAVMAEAPRVLASFESAYLAALAEMGSTSAISKDDLIFEAPTDSRWFIYEISDDAKTCYAIAKTNIGEFKKGDQIATQYDYNLEEFIHGSTNEAARDMIPRFFQYGMAKIGGRTDGGGGQRDAASAYQQTPVQSNQLSGAGSGRTLDSRLINPPGTVWWSSGGGASFDPYFYIFYEDGRWILPRTGGESVRGIWFISENKLTTITLDDGFTQIQAYSVKNTADNKTLLLLNGERGLELCKPKVQGSCSDDPNNNILDELISEQIKFE